MTDYAIQQITIWIIPILFAISLHEVAHGFAASLFGDQTARLTGRLSLNPIKHIDLIGTIIVPLLMFFFSNFIFGWAKPVPVDARNLRNPRRDMIFVACAGPIANFLMAILWGGIAKLGAITVYSGNEWLGIPLVYMGQAGIRINLILGLLNLLPIPPLDGGRVLVNLLPPRAAYQVERLEPYGFLILIFLMVTNVLGAILQPLFNYAASFIIFIFKLI